MTTNSQAGDEQQSTKGKAALAPDAENRLLRAQLDALQGKVSLLESTLLQREEEIEQTRRELEAARHHPDLAEALRSKLDEANAWVFRLAGERRKTERALQIADAHRDRAEKQIGALLAERARAEEAAQRLRERLESRIDELDAQESSLLLEVQRLQAEHQAAGSALAERAAAIDSLTTERARLDREVAMLQADCQTAAATLRERDVAIEGLSSELQENSGRLRAQRDLIGWLQLVALEILQSPGRWWFPLSREQRSQMIAQRLSQIGLFDAQSYLDRYEDVAQDGMHPLSHYLRHGMGEGRQR